MDKIQKQIKLSRDDSVVTHRYWQVAEENWDKSDASRVGLGITAKEVKQFR